MALLQMFKTQIKMIEMKSANALGNWLLKGLLIGDFDLALDAVKMFN